MNSVLGLNYEPLSRHEAEHVVDHSEESDSTQEEHTHPTEVIVDTIPEPLEANTGLTTSPELKVKDENTDQPISDNTYFENLKKKYESTILKSLSPNKPRTDIIIRYYHHAPDGNSAYALQKLGFYIHEREVTPEYADYQSNAVFYGDSVQLEDIQLVTYTLIKEGLPIKLIKPSKFANSWKAKSIEIGTDTTVIDRPNLSLDELRRLAL
ncbi:MAG: hypothetical protein RIC35_16490 [Marinoscillum sp.]